MAASEIVHFRVDPQTRAWLQAWADEKGTDLSGAMRAAIQLLRDEQGRAERLGRFRRQLDRAVAAGVFDPPSDATKAGGFR